MKEKDREQKLREKGWETKAWKEGWGIEAWEKGEERVRREEEKESDGRRKKFGD